MSSLSAEAAIIDYGMGNLFSVKNACEFVGLRAKITSSREEILDADGIILPGVGAFGDAMRTLKKLDLVSVLRDKVKSETPLLGVCLGMQLLMEESHEFGSHQGLSIIPGCVKRFESPQDREGRILKVPEVQWNRIEKPSLYQEKDQWASTLLGGITSGAFMYFVHSFYCIPEYSEHVISCSSYGQYTYCSSIKKRNVFACQYHPERSGSLGLKVYQNFSQLIFSQKCSEERSCYDGTS